MPLNDTNPNQRKQKDKGASHVTLYWRLGHRPNYFISGFNLVPTRVALALSQAPLPNQSPRSENPSSSKLAAMPYPPAGGYIAQVVPNPGAPNGHFIMCGACLAAGRYGVLLPGLPKPMIQCLVCKARNLSPYCSAIKAIRGGYCTRTLESPFRDGWARTYQGGEGSEEPGVSGMRIV